jgi:molybdopterin-guanine dinucleotide biosynthesis protein A
MSPSEVTGIVLGGGRSSRFGGDKLAVEVGGQPLLWRAVRSVAQVADEIVVVISPTGVEPELPGDLRMVVQFARDPLAGRGPLAGLAAGLAAASRPLALLAAGDQPFLRPEVLAALVAELDREPGAPEADVAVLEDGDRLWPFPAALRVATVRQAAWSALRSSDRRLFSLFGSLRVVRVAEARWRALDPDAETLRDVDTARDLGPLRSLRPSRPRSANLDPTAIREDVEPQ